MTETFPTRRPTQAAQHDLPRPIRLTAFDRAVLLAIGAMLAGLVLTLLLGDRVGVTVDRVAPLGVARSTSRITIQFSEQMQRDSVVERFRTEPAIPGELAWSGPTLIFRPSEPIAPGQSVTVFLEAGARSESGREVLSEYQFGFTVQRPRVAYLYPADNVPQNIWIVDPADPASAQQVTFSPSGIYDFAISPDGSKIAFSENNSNNGTNDIKLLDLETGGLVQLTNCADAACTTPVWRPDGGLIAYERVDFNTELRAQGIGVSPTRVWILDLSTTPATTRPLFSEQQVLGYNPQWSANGRRIAVADNSTAAILVYDFDQNNITAVQSRAGSSGALSPDGRRLVFPEITITEDQTARAYLRIADLETGQITYLSTPESYLDDARAAWRPDGQMLAIARRDESQMRGYQLYLVDPRTGDAERLTDDPRYENSYFWWDPTGTQLVIQRFPVLDENMQPNNSGRPEIWVYDVPTRTMTQAAVNGFLPRWVP